MKRFLEGNDGNAEPRLLHEVALDCVDAFGVRASRGPAGGFPRRDLQAEDAVRIIVGRVVEAAGNHEQLPELFLERHAPKQIAHAIFDGKFWILVGRRALQGRRQGQSEGQREKKWLAAATE